MQTWRICGAMALGFSVLAGSALTQQGRTQQEQTQQAAPTEAGPNWIRDYDTARVAAKQSGKPLFVAFRCER